MPKIGAEPVRRAALEAATIAEIGAAGSLDVTVGAIARRAGMSSALAHHYYGGKEQIFEAAMRRILRDFGAEVRAGLRAAATPMDRVEAVIAASFSDACFAPEVIAAWMQFYVQAQISPGALRLLRLYQRRLRSTLRHALRPLTPHPEHAADALGALIDGLYIRVAVAASMNVNEARARAMDVARGMV